MEKLTEIKEAIDCWKNGKTEYDSEKNLGVLIDLASQVVALGGKMPAKKEQWDNSIRYVDGVDMWGKVYKVDDEIHCSIFNKAIDLCTKAFVGMLGEKKDTKDNFVNDCYCNSCRLSETFCQCNGYNNLHDEILKKMGVE